VNESATPRALQRVKTAIFMELALIGATKSKKGRSAEIWLNCAIFLPSDNNHKAKFQLTLACMVESILSLGYPIRQIDAARETNPPNLPRRTTCMCKNADHGGS
jgi:hypothetical protein